MRIVVKVAFASMLVGLPAFCWAIVWAVDDTEIGAGVSTPLAGATPAAAAAAAAAADAVVPTPPCQPWRFFRWRFMCVVRLSTLWHTGHWVVPLCIFMCLYIESRFQNDLPQSLHECDGCSMTTVCESKSDTNVHAASWPRARGALLPDLGSRYPRPFVTLYPRREGNILRDRRRDIFSSPEFMMLFYILYFFFHKMNILVYIKRQINIKYV